eukprot:9586006-Ditylum_brightwellii.AAC.1
MPFDGKNLILFCNNFLTATLSCRQWSNLIQITTKSGARKNLLQDFALISEDDIHLTKANHMAQDTSAAINMFIALWSTFDRKVKTSMQNKAEKYSGD